VPFDAERKQMTIVRKALSGPVAYVKGAAAVLLHNRRSRLTRDGSIQPLDEGHRRDITEATRKLAGQGLRVLAVAMRSLDHEPECFIAAELEQDGSYPSRSQRR
jgi:Ca2+-transporting ATPase